MMKKNTKNIKSLIRLFFICSLSYNKVHSQAINPHEFSINGYIRTGIGGTDGGQMVNFVTPENLHKFRLGNEANHYGELQFNYRYRNKDSVNLYEVTYMMAKYIPFGSDGYKQFPETAQLYGKINKVVKNANIWLGKRYYDRRNVELLDYFWINSAQNSQIGLGLENYQIKNAGNLNLALIRFKYGNNNSHSYAADLRYLDVPVSQFSKLNFLGQYSIETENKLMNTQKHNGYALGTWYTYSKKNITHTSTILFRKGSSITENGYTGKTIREYRDSKRIYDLDKASSLDIINNFVYDDKRRHAIQASLTYQYRNFGTGDLDQNEIMMTDKASKNWMSVGFRYMYYINKYFNLALEAGNDYMKSDRSGLEGSLQKVTFSPQITLNYGYYSRPVFRPFITYAHWSESFKGITGESLLNNRLIRKTQGVSIGLQLEMWW
ncbi:carbohydrate porin [Chryseobacterium sp. ISL-6]|uniref:carbohydrate porin n=1 Tax=Chryseobacterium sp. ISL-6 TaxID=2819143 RepID=UPI001BEA60A7|nr:carbohydrate porin [Chryseobacterium sp. ISL-6]MBT2622183.1 carbohydrate porin [Chryseobacterium sp. ISL-6]